MAETPLFRKRSATRIALFEAASYRPDRTVTVIRSGAAADNVQTRRSRGQTSRATVDRRSGGGELVGTAAMDLLLYRRYRRSDGDDSLWRWESAAGVTTWDRRPRRVRSVASCSASPPGVSRPIDGRGRRRTSCTGRPASVGGPSTARSTGSTTRLPWLTAAALGPAAWLSGYAVLPLTGVYEPIWKYGARTLADDLSAHLVYGAATSAAFAVLSRRCR